MHKLEHKIIMNYKEIEIIANFRNARQNPRFFDSDVNAETLGQSEFRTWTQGRETL